MMNDLTWKEFERVDMRVGTILYAEAFKEAIKPAIKMTAEAAPREGYVGPELSGNLIKEEQIFHDPHEPTIPMFSDNK